MIPDRYKNAKYEDVPQGIRELFETMKDTRRGLYICGSVGTGKTHFAYALKQKYDHPQGAWYAQFYNMTKLLHDIRQDFDMPARDKKYLEEDIMGHEHLLIIDDVGAEKITDWVAETFYLIVNERYNRMYPTIFTSNLPIKDLADRIGDRTASRIVEMCDTVELVGKDHRITNHIKKVINV